MQKKNILLSLVGFLSLSFLAGCGSEDVVNENVNNSDANNQTDEINIIKNDKLAVDQNKCIGCGKCARIAPANFEMNAQTRKAQIKSNEITNQSLVDRAIASCAPKAISQ